MGPSLSLTYTHTHARTVLENYSWQVASNDWKTLAGGCFPFIVWELALGDVDAVFWVPV